MIIILPALAQTNYQYFLSMGMNWGFFDRYGGRGPVLFTEFEIELVNYLKVSPNLLLAYGNSDHSYLSMDLPEKQYASTTTIEPGLILKIIPLPDHFDNIKIIQGVNYLYEESVLSNTELSNSWNGKRTDKGINYTWGIDLDIVKLKNYRIGINWRVNTSKNRVLLYHLGLIANFKIAG